MTLYKLLHGLYIALMFLGAIGFFICQPMALRTLNRIDRAIKEVNPLIPYPTKFTGFPGKVSTYVRAICKKDWSEFDNHDYSYALDKFDYIICWSAFIGFRLFWLVGAIGVLFDPFK